MNAAQFYEAFDDGWSSNGALALKRLAGTTIKWKASTPAGALTFSIATNPKCAGLVPHLPGEFRLGITWTRRKDGKSVKGDVSWFQYSNEEENLAFAALQRSALEKFLAQPGKEGLRSIYNYANDPAWLPRANFDEYAYYLDPDDARAWGRWYGGHVAPWIERFERAPECFNDWCWRVLWPDTERAR